MFSIHRGGVKVVNAALPLGLVNPNGKTYFTHSAADDRKSGRQFCWKPVTVSRTQNSDHRRADLNFNNIYVFTALMWRSRCVFFVGQIISFALHTIINSPYYVEQLVFSGILHGIFIVWCRVVEFPLEKNTCFVFVVSIE